MERIKDFPLDTWIRKYGPISNVQFRGSSAPVLSVNQLLGMAASGTDAKVFDLDLNLDYGPFEGSAVLRSRIAELHHTPDVPITKDDVIITPGSILANYLILTTLCKPGDHVICQYPVFPQLHLLPKMCGIDVSLWAMKGDNWLLDTEDLARLIRPSTKAIILNNPNNPTGAVISKAFLGEIVDISRATDIMVFCDEVFRPLFHADNVAPPPVVSLGYEQSISTGSLSKAYGLPGARIGWIVSRNKALLRRILAARDYTTTTVSRLDDSLAAFALSPHVLPTLMERNLATFCEGIKLVDDFVKRNPRCRWTKPAGGGTACVRILDFDGKPVDDAAFCAKLAEEEGLCTIPCSWCFGEDGTDDFLGFCRFPLDPHVLRKGLPLLQRFLDK